MRRQVVGLVLSRGLGSLLQAATLVLLARSTTVEHFATITIWTGIAIVGCALADLGLSGYMLKMRAVGDAGGVQTAIRLNIWGSVSGAILTGIVAALATPNVLIFAIVVLVAALFTEKNADALLNLAVADKNVAVPAASIIGRRAVGLASFVALLVLGTEAALAYAGGYLAASVYSQFISRRYVRSGPAAEVVGKSVREVVHVSIKYMVPFLAGQSRTLDVAVVSIFGGQLNAGFYSAAVRLAQPALLIPGALGSVLLPHSSRQGEGYERRAVARLAKWTLLAAPLLVVVAFASEPIVVTLFGEAFRASAPAFGWATFGILFLGMSAPMAGVLQGQGGENFVAVVSFVGAVLLLALVGLGAGLAGATGAGMGFAAAAVARWLAMIGGSRRLGTRAQ